MTVPASVHLKLGRAEKHLYSLAYDIGAYLEGAPTKLVLNVQPSDPRKVLVELHVIAESDQRFGLIIGDCVHNMRSALDHLACRLVEANHGTITKGTQFPIMDERPKDKLGNPLKPSIAGGVADDVLTVIDGLEPYRLGNDAPLHPLAILRELSNADKHRLFHTTAARSAGNRCTLRAPGGAVIAATFVPIAEHETAVAAFQFPEPFDTALYGDMQVEAEGSDFVAIKEPGPWAGKPILLVLEEIRQFVGKVVVANLDPFLD